MTNFFKNVRFSDGSKYVRVVAEEYTTLPLARQKKRAA